MHALHSIANNVDDMYPRELLMSGIGNRETEQKKISHRAIRVLLVLPLCFAAAFATHAQNATTTWNLPIPSPGIVRPLPSIWSTEY